MSFWRQGREGSHGRQGRKGRHGRQGSSIWILQTPVDCNQNLKYTQTIYMYICIYALVSLASTSDKTSMFDIFVMPCWKLVLLLAIYLIVHYLFYYLS